MKDIDRINILDVLNLKIASDIMEKFSVEKLDFRGGDMIISPPVLIGLRSYNKKCHTKILAPQNRVP